MTEKFPNFHRLVPILYVKDLSLEVEFYKCFGFEIFLSRRRVFLVLSA